MPPPNRVDPFCFSFRSQTGGIYMGTGGGVIHNDQREMVRAYKSRQWITCLLQFKARRRTVMSPRRYTELFFLDEAVAFAAGHRPCAECRHADYERYRDAWEAAFGTRLGADDMDARLHADRLDGRSKRFHMRPWRDLPAGTFVDVDGLPALVTGDELRARVSASGYRAPVRRPTTGISNIITPASNLEVLRAGYVVEVSPAGAAT